MPGDGAPSKKYTARVIGNGAGVMRSSDEMEACARPAAASLPQEAGREAQDQPMLVEDHLAAEVYIKDDVHDGDHKSHSLQGWIMGSNVALGLVYTGIFIYGCWLLSHLFAEHAETHTFGWAVAGIFVLLAVPISLHGIHMHAIHYVSELQRYYIRVIWMVPIYSVQSWLALYFKDNKVYLETIREAYESWVIFSYFMLLREYLHNREADAIWVGRKGKGCQHMFPFKYFLRPWLLGAEFMDKTLYGVYQYVFLRTFFAVLVLIAEVLHLYGEGEWDNPYRLYVWQMIVVNTSQTWALYCLLLFYHEMKQGLLPLAPLGKFVAVKCVIFLSFWQSVLISVLASNGYLSPTLDYTEEDVSKGLQDFLICIEMGVAAVAFHYTFSWKDFAADGPLLASIVPVLGKSHSRKGVGQAMIDMLPTDVVEDVKEKYEDWQTRFGVSSTSALDRMPAPDISAPYYLGVNIVRGIGFKGMDRSGLSDPYLMLQIGDSKKQLSYAACAKNKKYKTKIILQNLNPEWKEFCEIPLSAEEVMCEDQVVKVSVWDWDRFGSDDQIGEFQVHLSKIRKLSREETALAHTHSLSTKWYTLHGLAEGVEEEEGEGNEEAGGNTEAGEVQMGLAIGLTIDA